MFGAFNPSATTKKRKAPTQIESLEAQTKPRAADEEMTEIVAEIKIDGGELEDIKIAEEGEAMLKQVKSNTGRSGYDPDDFVCQTFEYDNCTHEFVAPKGYERPKDWKRPKLKPKQYKFTLDKF